VENTVHAVKIRDITTNDTELLQLKHKSRRTCFTVHGRKQEYRLDVCRVTMVITSTYTRNKAIHYILGVSTILPKKDIRIYYYHHHWGVKLTHLHLMPTSRTVELYLHSTMSPWRIVLNELSTGTALSLLLL
jgi:hypothetical protein